MSESPRAWGTAASCRRARWPRRWAGAAGAISEGKSSSGGVLIVDIAGFRTRPNNSDMASWGVDVRARTWTVMLLVALGVQPCRGARWGGGAERLSAARVLVGGWVRGQSAPVPVTCVVVQAITASVHGRLP